MSELMLEGHRPPLDEAKCSPRLRKLIRRCWAQCPIDRPARGWLAGRGGAFWGGSCVRLFGNRFCCCVSPSRLVE